MGVAGPQQLAERRMADMTRPAARTQAQTYLNLALFAFAFLGLELVLLAVEPVLRLRPGSVPATVIHWTLTIIIWVGGAIGLGAWALRRTDFKLRGDAASRIGVRRWVAVAGLVVVTVIAQWVLRGGVFAPVAEHQALSESFGDAGTLVWLVQVAYYCAELLVVVLIIGFGQQAGERSFRPKWAPWGGVMLALTWGLVHALTQEPATAIYGVALSVVMGAVHVLTGRNLFVTYPFLLVMFIL